MGSEVRDPYQTLEVTRNASESEIRSSFRRLAAKYHPDKNPDDEVAQAHFKEVNAAFQILSDPHKRAVLDRQGPRAFDPGAPPVGVDLGGIDGLFGDLLNAIGIKTGDRGDLKQKVVLSFEEAALGCEKQITYARADVCRTCNGRGAPRGTLVSWCTACQGRGRIRFQQGVLPFAIDRGCSTCRGTGQIPKVPCDACGGAGITKAERTIEISLPPGIESGATRTIDGAGNRLRPEKPAGALELVVEVKEHPFFTRRGQDLHCSAPVTFAQAALGGEIDVPSLQGKLRVRVPPSTQPGSVLRLRGKGLPHRRRASHGDMLVELIVEVPTAISDRARKLIEELANELGEEVQPQQRTFMEKLRSLFG